MKVTREMEEVRTRLEAYRDKIQPYPAYPKEETEEQAKDTVPELSEYLTHKIKKLGELEGRLIYIQGKLNEHIAYSKPKSNKYKKYI